MLRLHTTSTGLDPASLVAGRDLVLRLHALHGTDAATGTYALDHLDPASRREADLLTVALLGRWREGMDEPLTAEGLCWPHVWHMPLYLLMHPVVTRALALREAIRAFAPERLVLADDDDETARLAAAVAAHAGVPVERVPGAPSPGPPMTMPPPVPRMRRARQAAIRTATRFGAPSRLRRGSVAFRSYWPILPLLDHALADRSMQPAIFLANRPTGVRRSLLAARQGGWVGVPSALDRMRARRPAARLLERVLAGEGLDADGMDLGPLLLPLIAQLVRTRAADDLAEAAMLRRAFATSPPRWVVTPFDVVPEARLKVLLAQEAGARTLGFAHGAFLVPEPFSDLELCDEVVLWSREVGPTRLRSERPVHVVGYPLPHDVAPPTRTAPPKPRIAVLGQVMIGTTALLDERVTLSAYEAALAAIARRAPHAQVVIRPHPVEDRAAVPEAIRRFPQLDVEVEPGGDILDFHRGVDLCISGATAATLQTVLAGTPAIVLNLSGADWRYPLGGDSAVPIARAAEDLDAIIGRWAAGETLPGREDLAAGLGAHGGDPTERIAAILA